MVVSSFFVKTALLYVSTPVMSNEGGITSYLSRVYHVCVANERFGLGWYVDFYTFGATSGLPADKCGPPSGWSF